QAQDPNQFTVHNLSLSVEKRRNSAIKKPQQCGAKSWDYTFSETVTMPSGAFATLMAVSVVSTKSASSSRGESAGTLTAITWLPAFSPASTPAAASSTTTQSAGARPSSSAPSKNASGSGLPRVTRSAVMNTSGFGKPAALWRA